MCFLCSITLSPWINKMWCDVEPHFLEGRNPQFSLPNAPEMSIFLPFGAELPPQLCKDSYNASLVYYTEEIVCLRDCVCVCPCLCARECEMRCSSYEVNAYDCSMWSISFSIDTFYTVYSWLLKVAICRAGLSISTNKKSFFLGGWRSQTTRSKSGFSTGASFVPPPISFTLKALESPQQSCQAHRLLFGGLWEVLLNEEMHKFSEELGKLKVWHIWYFRKFILWIKLFTLCLLMQASRANRLRGFSPLIWTCLHWTHLFPLLPIKAFVDHVGKPRTFALTSWKTLFQPQWFTNCLESLCLRAVPSLVEGGSVADHHSKI